MPVPEVSIFGENTLDAAGPVKSGGITGKAAKGGFAAFPGNSGLPERAFGPVVGKIVY